MNGFPELHSEENLGSFNLDTLYDRVFEARSKEIFPLSSTAIIPAQCRPDLHYVNDEEHETLNRNITYLMTYSLLLHSKKNFLALGRQELEEASKLFYQLGRLMVLGKEKDPTMDAERLILEVFNLGLIFVTNVEFFQMGEAIRSGDIPLDGLDGSFPFHTDFYHENSVSLGKVDWLPNDTPVLMNLRAITEMVYRDVRGKVTAYEDPEAFLSTEFCADKEKAVRRIATAIIREYNETGLFSLHLVYLMWCAYVDRTATDSVFFKALFEKTLLDNFYSAHRMAWIQTAAHSIKKIPEYPSKEVLLEGISARFPEEMVLAKFDKHLYPEEPPKPVIVDKQGDSIIPFDNTKKMPRDNMGKPMIEVLDDLLARIL